MNHYYGIAKIVRASPMWTSVMATCNWALRRIEMRWCPFKTHAESSSRHENYEEGPTLEIISRPLYVRSLNLRCQTWYSCWTISYAKSEDRLLNTIAKFLTVCNENGLKINAWKSPFFPRSLEFDGKSISKNGIIINPRNIEAILNMKFHRKTINSRNCYLLQTGCVFRYKTTRSSQNHYKIYSERHIIASVALSNVQ